MQLMEITPPYPPVGEFRGTLRYGLDEEIRTPSGTLCPMCGEGELNVIEGYELAVIIQGYRKYEGRIVAVVSTIPASHIILSCPHCGQCSTTMKDFHDL